MGDGNFKKRIGRWIDADGRSLPFTQVTELECIAIGQDRVGIRLVLQTKGRETHEALRFELPNAAALEFAESLIRHVKMPRRTDQDPGPTLQ